MRRYLLVDKATGEETEADAYTVERVTEVEISYFNWCIKQDGKFKTGTGKCGFCNIIGDPIGTEDLFAKRNRVRQR